MQTKPRERSLFEKVSQAIDTFFFKPASARPLSVLRMGVAVTLLVQALLLQNVFFDLFSSSGILQGSVARYLFGPQFLDTSWFVARGFEERTVLVVLGLTYVSALVGLLFGCFTRASAILAWFTHWVLMNTGYSANYGVDVFAHIFLFYFIFMPMADVWSIDALRREKPSHSSAARFALRLIQLQLCIAYFATAAEKAVGPQWQDGEVIWRALNLPIYIQYDMSWLANYTWLCKLAAWGTLVVEGLYCVFIWPRQTRTLWVVATAAMHVGIAVFLGLEIFGVFMLCLTVAAFGVSSEPISKPVTAVYKERKAGHAIASI